MVLSKYIRVHGDEVRYGNAFIVSHRYDMSLAHLKELAEVAREDFPELTDAEIFACKVAESRWCKGSTVIWFSVPPDTIRPLYARCDSLPDISIT